MNKQNWTTLALACLALEFPIAAQPSGFAAIAREMGGVRGLAIGGASPRRYYPSEGTTIRLRDGRILHAFNWREQPQTGQSRHPHFVRTEIAAVYSSDAGRTWTAPVVLLTSDTRTASHPSLVRLANDELGITYNKIASAERAVKVFRFSRDEGKTWSSEIMISPGDAYWTSAHDRTLVLSSGRTVIPLHNIQKAKPEHMITQVAYSDDNGRSWKMSPQKLDVSDVIPSFQARFKFEGGFWESSIAERADGSLLMLGRTYGGYLYQCESADKGLTWSQPKPSTLTSAAAPGQVRRVPGSSDLLVAWNSCCLDDRQSLLGNRLTLSTAISTDGGRTWKWQREVESVAPPPGATFTDVAYPSIYFDGDSAYMTYFVRRVPGEVEGEQYLSVLPLSWLYAGRDYDRRAELQPAKDDHHD